MNHSFGSRFVLATASLLLVLQSHAFMPNCHSKNLKPWGGGVLFSSKTADSPPAAVEDDASLGPHQSNDDESMVAVRAPLKFLGPYPSLSLRFPELATSSQRSRNVTGVSLDFVLDTAANINTINGAVAQELKLEKQPDQQAPPGVSTTGAMLGGETFMLGDAQLEGVLDENEKPFLFMTDLSASALPIANPAAAGLLSLAFFQTFDGGVELEWGDSKVDDSKKGPRPPSVTFYSSEGISDSRVLKGRTRVPIQRIPVTQLPMVTIKINGVSIPALLDTGSPVTVLNAQAAQQAGIETVAPSDRETGNPFTNWANRFQQAQAASRGEVLTIIGVSGKPTQLVKSTSPPIVSLPVDEMDDDAVDFGEGHVYVGNLPGLEVLKGLGVDAPPAVVLGMDVLRRRPRVLLRAQQNEIWL